MRKSLIVITTLLMATTVSATVRTVKTAGGDFTTIAACDSASSAGDTCTVFAGTYAGWTEAKDGSSGLPITFKANAGDSVVINSTINLGAHSWIVVGGAVGGYVASVGSGATVNGSTEGFESSGASNWILFKTMNHVVVQNNYIHNTGGRCFQGSTSATGASFNRFTNNIAEFCGGVGPGQAQCILIEGNNNLIESGICRHVEDGCACYGTDNVMRNMHFGPNNHTEIG